MIKNIAVIFTLFLFNICNLAYCQNFVSDRSEGRITKLEIKGLGIKTVPKEIGNLTGLFRLTINNNQFIPFNKIGKFHTNKFTINPDGLKEGLFFETLRLRNNQITSELFALEKSDKNFDFPLNAFCLLNHQIKPFNISLSLNGK